MAVVIGNWEFVVGGRGSASRCPSPSTSVRPGMTLLELLLVLVLLVVLASLTMPLLEGSFASVRLRRGTDLVLAMWARTRTAAIDSGQIHQFRFREQTGDYRAEPWPTDEQSPVYLSAVTTLETASDKKNQSKSPTIKIFEADGTVIIQARLPEEVVILRGTQAFDADTGKADSQRTIATLTGDRKNDWSQPILFFPDGTTTNASLLLGNERKQYQRATLRGLTGVGRASNILTESDRDGM